jgi:4-carboxymuconolactone decarboxylase
MPEKNRYERGIKRMREVDGEDGIKVLKILEAISPDFAKYVVEYPFGDVYSRPGLDLRSREIASIAALAAMGNAKPQLKTHIAGALRAGVTREEIAEIMIHISVFAGFPAALNGMFAAKEVCDREDEINQRAHREHRGKNKAGAKGKKK